MNNKNKIVNFGYQLATIIIKLMFLLLLNIFTFITSYINENNNGNNYNKIVSLG
jgi:hypothetical protein